MYENDNVNIHLAFPTAIYTTQPENHERFTKLLNDTVDQYRFDHHADRDWYIVTGEHVGLINIHHNPLYEDFFKMIAYHASSYVNALGMRNDLFDYYVNKSWLSVIDEPDQYMVYHIHSNSDISFVYYTEVPEEPECISFRNPTRPNQLFEGMMDDERPIEKTFFRERNTLNYNTFFIPPQPGLLVMFPGKLPHGTVRNPHTNKPQVGRRTAIAGDISLVLKPGYNDFESGRICLEHLRKFEVEGI